MDQVGDIVRTDQYLTFTLAEETFAIEIVKVREVIDYVHLTRVPRMPVFLRGVINLRGSVVPVIDLRLILSMPAVEKTVDTCIIIAEVNMDGEPLHLGMLADSVQEVIDIDPSQIDPPPRLGSMLNTEFIRGMGKRGEGFFIILNIDQVLSSDEMAGIEAVKTAATSRAPAAAM
jgi:purine-binding chemotaxis protein CheW